MDCFTVQYAYASAAAGQERGVAACAGRQDGRMADGRMQDGGISSVLRHTRIRDCQSRGRAQNNGAAAI